MGNFFIPNLEKTKFSFFSGCLSTYFGMVSHLLFLHSSVTDNSFTQSLFQIQIQTYGVKHSELLARANGLHDLRIFTPCDFLFSLGLLKRHCLQEKVHRPEQIEENISRATCQKSDRILRTFPTMQLPGLRNVWESAANTANQLGE